MCDHEEILEYGEYICTKCGLVLGQQYISEKIYSESPKNDKNKSKLYIDICNILENINLNIYCYADDVYDLINKYLSDFKCENELKIGASIYYVLTINNIACHFNRISRLLCSNINDSKKLFKLYQVFPQQNILSNNITKLAEIVLSFTTFEKLDKNNILRLLKVLTCKHCSYSPITQIAGISYWYFKTEKNQKKSKNKIICEYLLISQNSVHLYLNHSCVNKWTTI